MKSLTPLLKILAVGTVGVGAVVNQTAFKEQSPQPVEATVEQEARPAVATLGIPTIKTGNDYGSSVLVSKDDPFARDRNVLRTGFHRPARVRNIVEADPSAARNLQSITQRPAKEAVVAEEIPAETKPEIEHRGTIYVTCPPTIIHDDGEPTRVAQQPAVSKCPCLSVYR